MTELMSAKGVTGHLIWSGETYYFRVYDKVGIFCDYKILHCDLEITIKDADAFLYPASSDPLCDGTLDHSPETLGKLNA